MTSFAPAIALNRFGLGARPGEAAPARPPASLLRQLDAFAARPAPIAAVEGSAALAAQLGEGLIAARPAGAAPDAEAFDANMLRATVRRQARDGYVAQAGARVSAALASDTPFAERLTHFWANHFAVSADKLVTVGLAGTLEFEAIRPNIAGRFADMLLAVVRHPAMLLYLDQAGSVGPDSRLAQFARARNLPRQPGLNENLAREILELHTLGARDAYTQADVGELARALTGWSLGGYARGPLRRALADDGPPGRFAFFDAIHQPGARTLLGKRYPAGGAGQAEAMLRDLAVHPATATHLATRLARHFVADAPPRALVARLARVHLQTGGELGAVTRALVESPEAWAEPTPKFRSPWDWTIAALRGVGAREASRPMLGMLGELGQPPWRPGSPAGWPDGEADWAGPDALLRRVEVAGRLAETAAAAHDARALAPTLLPGVLTPRTAAAIARAETPAQGLALLLVSPEFLRR
jgi:uncharacterized protein (DUF1800 family)